MFIREHNGHKYRIYTANHDRTVIAVSSFAGKTVKGIAKCDPKDDPNIEKGIELAILRCDEKISTKKVARGIMKVKAAEAEVAAANKKLANAQEYLIDSENKLFDASQKLTYFSLSL